VPRNDEKGRASQWEEGEGLAMTGRGGAREEEKKRKACGGKKGRAMQGGEGSAPK